MRDSELAACLLSVAIFCICAACLLGVLVPRCPHWEEVAQDDLLQALGDPDEVVVVQPVDWRSHPDISTAEADSKNR